MSVIKGNSAKTSIPESHQSSQIETSLPGSVADPRKEGGLWVIFLSKEPCGWVGMGVKKPSWVKRR
jgi:hypothetical protein